MSGGTGLVVIHVDGLSHARLLEAIKLGHMPFVARLIDSQGYEALGYRCGVPSTTPFAQAGILFGDNSEIPSYRWWDKPTDALIAFGEGSTFDLVADRYFKGCEPLTSGGACIAALYRAGATDRFGPRYRERHRPDEHDAGGRAIAAFLLNPVTLYFWIRHGGLALFRITRDYLRARFAGRRPANVYVVADIYHEVLVHHLTRFALLQAMDEGLPVIYACFYTYDEAAHAFGPTDPNTLRVLRHIDSTIRLAAERAANKYEIAVLSDHGQVETTPFVSSAGKSLGQFVSEWLPGHRVTEHRGGVFGPPDGKPVEITYSGGLAHVYVREFRGRLDHAQVEATFPGLITKLAALEQIGVVMTKGMLTTAASQSPLGDPLTRETAGVLSRFDEPDVLGRQLRRLNSFERAGDLVLFGAYDGSKQVNFEAQVGGHGSIGGQQLHPFILAKREWGFETGGITNASELHPLLVRLRDRLAGSAEQPHLLPDSEPV
ncbi:MAG TPA: alkaline phosphatase family protein [Candidatus Dormibacteraeota bacterium]|nr:alkaline phosphatase family protein [Candidatus Dormibacteraeota bacterium]